MMSRPRILFTGFAPFLGEKMNPSQILLEWLKEDLRFQGQVDTLLLPVVFDKAFPQLQSLLEKQSYDYIFSLGQAGGRSKVSLERVALNWIETENPDEDGQTPSRGLILPGKPPALFTDLPLAELKELLTCKGLPVEISLSAGGYVCNHLYYKTLLWLMENKVNSQCCFIHVPYLPEQTEGKETVACLELEVMKSVFLELLNQINALQK